jgi:hypothetical protein
MNVLFHQAPEVERVIRDHGLSDIVKKMLRFNGDRTAFVNADL